jgi:hypothetical protein
MYKIEKDIASGFFSQFYLHALFHSIHLFFNNNVKPKEWYNVRITYKSKCPPFCNDYLYSLKRLGPNLKFFKDL